MNTEPVKQTKLGLPTILAFLILASGLVSVWINTQVAIARIDTKVVELELRIRDNAEGNQKDINRLYFENRDDHKELKQSIKELGDMISKKKGSL
jgi:hypothetical protein